MYSIMNYYKTKTLVPPQVKRNRILPTTQVPFHVFSPQMHNHYPKFYGNLLVFV